MKGGSAAYRPKAAAGPSPGSVLLSREIASDASGGACPPAMPRVALTGNLHVSYGVQTHFRSTAVAAVAPSDEPKHRRRLHAIEGALLALPLWLRAAAAAYAVVALFGLAYLVVSQTWGSLSSEATIWVAALIAAPLALGLLWPRLSGLKAFGFEVSITQVTVQPNPKLATAIMSRDLGSREPDLVRQMAAITEPNVELLEVDLRDGTYWWSTRLFLLAALAHDLSDVRAFAFTSGGADRRFVGIITPVALRRAFGAQTPELEARYLEVARPATTADPSSRVESIVYAWTARTFGEQPEVDEADFASRVSPESLRAALAEIGQELGNCSIDWPGYEKPQMLRALVRDFDGEYVALLRSGSLDRIVNRLALSVSLAADRA